MQETRVQSLGWEDPLEEGMANPSTILPGEFHGQRSLVGCSPWGCTESDTTELTKQQEPQVEQVCSPPWRNLLSACGGRSPVFFVTRPVRWGHVLVPCLRTQQGSELKEASTGVDLGWVLPESMQFGRLAQRKRILWWVQGLGRASYKLLLPHFQSTSGSHFRVHGLRCCGGEKLSAG